MQDHETYNLDWDYDAHFTPMRYYIGVTDMNQFVEGVIVAVGEYYWFRTDMYTEDIHIGEWIVDLWGRDEEGTLISECSFGGFAEAEWEPLKNE